MHIESKEEEAERARDLKLKSHLMSHLDTQQQLLPKILELQVGL